MGQMMLWKLGCVSGSKIEICWDLTNAKCGYEPGPMEGFYLAVALNQEIVTAFVLMEEWMEMYFSFLSVSKYL